MILITTPYDEYIDGPKLTKQKKTFEYIVPLTEVGRNNKKGNLVLNPAQETVDGTGMT